MAKRRVKPRPDVRAACVPLRGALALALGLGLLSGGPAAAQTVRITPSLDTRLTWTDNVDTAQDNEQQDWIAEVSPGVAISRESGRLSGGLSLRLRNVAHAEETEKNTSFLALQGRGSFEAIEDALFVDVGASVSRDNTSAFGGRFGGDPLDTDKNNETRTLSIGPRFAFRFGASGQGNIGYQTRWLTGGSNALGDQRTGIWNVGLSDPAALRLLGWGLSYSRTDTRYSEGGNRDVSQDVGRGTLFVNLSPQFRLRAIGGYESNDYGVASGESGNIWGAGFDWYPTDRTSLSVTGEDRIFGNGYNVDFRHRMARSVWALSARRDITSSLRDLAGGYVLDPLYQAIYDALGIQFPELGDFERERAAFELYQRFGAGGIRTNSYTLRQSFSAGVSLVGVRNTLSFTVQQSDDEGLNTLSGLAVNDDLATFDKVKTRSASVNFRHSLSGLSALNATALRSKSEGQGADSAETTRTSFSLGLTRRLGAQTSGSLTYRHIKSDGSNDYTENAVTATLGMRF